MLQDVYRASASQIYPLGMRHAKGDRVWRYTQLATTTRIGGYGAPLAGGLGLFSTAISSGALTIVTAALGARTVTISNPALVVNAYAGGLFTMYESGLPMCIMGIMSNTATVITLDGPLPATYTAGVNNNAHVIPGPWHEVIIPGATASGNPFDFCAGIFNSPLDEAGNVTAAGDYCWIQTWGMCNLWAYQSYPGDETGEREVVMCGEGSAQINTALANTTFIGMQRIGCLYPCTGPAGDNVGEHPNPTGGVATTMMNHIIYLQIAP